MAARVEIDSFGWRYASRTEWVVRDLSLTIESGERVLILGASGSGKSTLLKALAGVLDADTGELNGSVTITSDHGGDVRAQVGLVLQDPDAQVMLSRVGDDVAFGCENLGVPVEEMLDRTRSALEAVSLHGPLDAETDHLSGGQKQRLALAGMLAMQPSLMLLDEPTAMLDTEAISELREAVRTLVEAQSITLVIVEHRTDVWLDLIDRVIVLGHGGEVVCDGHPDTVFREYAHQLHSYGVWMPTAEETSAKSAEPHQPEHTSSHVLHTSRLAVGRSSEAEIIPIDDFVLEPGSVTAIIGANGTGKSTLALTLGGLLTPRSGAIHLSDETQPENLPSVLLPQRVASVFQVPEHQFVRNTVRAELELGLRTSASHLPSDTRVREVAMQFGIDHLLEANPFTLSGGEQRRLSVASAIIAEPEVLVLDEPSFGQDARTWQALVNALRTLRDRGCAIVVVTHDESLVRELANAVIHFESAEAMRPLHVHSEVRQPPSRRIRTINPLAKLAAAAVISLSLVLTLDWVSAAAVLLCELVLLPWVGLPLKKIATYVTPIVFAAVLAGFSVVLYGQRGGATLVEFGLIHISELSVQLGVATSLRIIAMAVAAVLLLAAVDPVDLSDALEQHTSVPARFVVGALVSLRLLSLLSTDWQTLSRARRARGLGDRKTVPVLLNQAFALFVIALRRADKLSIAMQARGFGGSTPRTWFRRSHFGTAEVNLILIGCAIAVFAVALAVVTGSWNFVFAGVQ